MKKCFAFSLCVVIISLMVCGASFFTVSADTASSQVSASSQQAEQPAEQEGGLAENLTSKLINAGIPPEVVVFIISLFPVLELRGGLIAASILGLKWYIAFPICFLGNIIPIPFILLFIRKIFTWMRKNKRIDRLITKFEARTMKKGKKIQNGWLIGLIIFVGIPLPVTGAWTGALAADLFNIRFKHSLPAIAIGIIMAGCIMLVVSYFLPGLFGFKSL